MHYKSITIEVDTLVTTVCLNVWNAMDNYRNFEYCKTKKKGQFLDSANEVWAPEVYSDCKNMSFSVYPYLQPLPRAFALPKETFRAIFLQIYVCQSFLHFNLPCFARYKNFLPFLLVVLILNRVYVIFVPINSFDLLRYNICRICPRIWLAKSCRVFISTWVKPI